MEKYKCELHPRERQLVVANRELIPTLPPRRARKAYDSESSLFVLSSCNPPKLYFFYLISTISAQLTMASSSQPATVPSNSAAYLTKDKKPNPLEVKSAPYTPPRDKEIVIKNVAIAINPSDFIKQDLGTMMYPWAKAPFVLGTDAAGEIVEVGSGVTRFKVGDRVVGHAIGIDEKINSSAEGAFQLYTVLRAEMTTPIPSTMSYESASVIPLGASTAACGLFQKDQLALQHPSTSVAPNSTGKTLLIWGGSTSVGSNAIQLAVAAGYEVITTCSPKNFEYVKKLGASQAFDYNSKTAVTDIIHAFEGKTMAGAFSIGSGSSNACLDVVDKCKGDKFIAMATYPVPNPLPERFVLPTNIFYYLTGATSIWVKAKARGIRWKFIFGTTLLWNGVGKAVYEDFLPGALAEGKYIAAPDPQVVGKGLENIQPAIDVMRKGLSAKKLVVTL
jgi:NADPH:quinone reductase-like Zn-dependent oxidoreductase